MIACPPVDQLSALLSGTLGEPGLSKFETHVSGCTHCQQRLNELTEAPRLTAWLGPHAARVYPFLEPANRPGDLGRIGRFRVEAELGRGGMGVVFRGWDEELNRAVALKVLRVGHDDAPAQARFHRESQAAAGLTHDHIVPVYGIERTADGRPVIVMPVVPGPSLRDRLRAEPLAPRESANIVRQVADALAAAHAAGLVHRDVKTANVLLDSTDGRAKLSDFGLARPTAHGDTVTQSGAIVGTPEYLSPEQARDAEAVDARSDIYSLGVTLYECLTGVTPFRGPPLDVLSRHATDDPIPPRRLNAVTPLDLETVCLKCLEKEPSRRYPTAAAVRDDLDRWLDGRPIVVRPLGPIGRARRWARRNPLPVAVVGVAVLGGLAAGAGWWRAAQKADEADANAQAAATREHEAAVARTVADDKAALANERSALALAAVNTLVTKAQDLAGDTPGTLKLKQQLNEAALADLRRLTAEIGRVPGADKSTMAAHQKLGDTFNLLGQTREALQEWAVALAQAEELLAADGNDLESRVAVARAHYSIGFTRNRLQDFKAATAHMDAAVGAFNDVELTDRKALDMLATAVAGRADVAWLTGAGDAAAAGYQRSLALRARVLEAEPDNADVRSKILHTHSRIGYVCLSVLYDYPTAERHFREQLAVAKVQLTKTPDDPVWRRNHDIILLDLSASLQRAGNGPGAEQAAREAVGPLERAAKADPDNARAQRDHAMAHDHLGLALLIQGKYADAERSFARALELLQAVTGRAATVAVVAGDVPIICYKLAVTAEVQGKYAEAANWYDRMAEAFKKGTTANPFQVQQFVTALANKRTAAQRTPQALDDPGFAYRQPADLAPALAANRIAALAHRGDVVTARQELAELRKRFPQSPFTNLVAPFVEAGAARRAMDEAERQRFLDAGAAALIVAVKWDRTLLETLHVLPDLTPLRTHPAFLKAVRPPRSP